MIGEVIVVGVERDEPATFAVNRRDECLRARFAQELAVSQLGEESIEGGRVSRGRSLTGMHARRDTAQEWRVLGAERANVDVLDPA